MAEARWKVGQRRLRQKGLRMMKIDNRKLEWHLYPGWIVLSAISMPIAFAIYWALIPLITEAVGSTIQVGGQSRITEDFLLPYILCPVLGLVTGLLQYLLLRRHLRRMGWWIAATTLGWSLGLIGDGALYRMAYGALGVSAIGLGTLMAALAGGAMGLPQWLVLRRRVHHAAWWIPASVLGWGVVGWGQAALPHPMGIPTVGILLVPGIATGVALWLLLNQLPQREGSGRNTPPNKSAGPILI